MAAQPASSHSSDLCQAVIKLTKQSDLIGYRNVLSYVAALGLRVFPKDATDENSWELLGSGSHSATYKGAFHQLRKEGSAFAIKQPIGSLTRDKPEVEYRVQHDALSSIIQELRILADPKLKSHPNLPHILGVYFQEEETVPGVRPCLIFDLAISDFKDFLRRPSRERRDPMEVVKACSEIASGICALHAYGLVHGDIKPENVLMFERGGESVATVGDLGTCGVPSQLDKIIGTRSFWAPELHPGSAFHPFINCPPRDVYSFGLVAYAAAIQYREHPFPNQVLEQFILQHNDELCLDWLLSKMPQQSKFDHVLRDTVRLCVRANPDARPSIFEVSRMLEKSLGQGRELEEMQEIAENALISNPNTPRVNILGQMPLPEHLQSKLQAEFTILAQDSESIRTALTMSAFYGGILGPGIEKPWGLIAKCQWLLKAVELGSHAAATITIISDKDVLAVLEVLGLQALEFRRPFFRSPEVDADLLRFRIKEFSSMGDEDVSLKLLPLITPTPTPAAEHVDGILESQPAAMASHGCQERDAFLQKFTITRGSDLSLLDSDALDINFGDKDDIVKSAYNNDLEAFITLAEENGLTQGTERLQYHASVAVMNGSFEVVRYIMEQYGEGPNDSWGGTTHLEDSIMFGRSKIASYYLERGASLVPTDPGRPSVLHYLPRYDDEELGRAICRKLENQGSLRRVLNWMPTGEVFTHKSPLWAAVTTGAWKTARLYLQLGADVNLEANTDRVLDVAITPRSPAIPIDTLEIILLRGGDPNAFTEDTSPALQWPIWSSNVLAVQVLLLHGAKPLLANEYDFFQLAEEVFKQRSEERPVDVVDEDGKIVGDSWARAIEASRVILEIVTFARDGQPGWHCQIQESVESFDKGCLGKYWMVIGEKPTMGAIEVKVPVAV